MFEQTNRMEIGETITYIRDLAEALRRAYVNGREPVPGMMNYEREREEHRFAVRSVLAKLSQWPFKGSAVFSQIGVTSRSDTRRFPATGVKFW
jgi:hypothetical protein